MANILKKIEAEARKLENSALCQWLENSSNDQEDRLSFIPSMLFFVLGFRDMLRVMKVSSPKSDMDYEINTHCDEDLDHWKWYLRDLERLGFISQSWGGRVSDIFRQIWGDASFEVRNIVYSIITEVKSRNNPTMSLILIEYLEAAFGVFVRYMMVPIHQSGYYDELQYFGILHVEKEANHSRGAWIDGQRSLPAQSLSLSDLDDGFSSDAEAVIDRTSAQMLRVFDYWYASRKDFVRYSTKDDNIAVREEAVGA